MIFNYFCGCILCMARIMYKMRTFLYRLTMQMVYLRSTYCKTAAMGDPIKHLTNNAANENKKNLSYHQTIRMQCAQIKVHNWLCSVCVSVCGLREYRNDANVVNGLQWNQYTLWLTNMSNMVAVAAKQSSNVATVVWSKRLRKAW